ncbi:hypothetical protein [Streptomyces sp. NPDC017964]|uniref:hypothetical protein n=1 Tax=Streptomyces sp. NPDC017964 TaxID=3365022 RepID=UPI0037990DE5
MSSCGGEVDGESGVFVERFAVLEAVVELAEHAVEEVSNAQILWIGSGARTFPSDRSTGIE